MKRVSDAINNINSNAICVIKNNTDIDNCEIEWLEDTTPISMEEIKKEWDKL